VLYVGQVEEKVAFTFKVKCIWRHGETSQLLFSDKDNMSETEGKTMWQNFHDLASGETACTTALKYCSVNSLRKELYRQRNGVLLWTLSSFKFIYFQYIYLCSKEPRGCSDVPQVWGRFVHDASSEININYIKM
jgi:hypothetical protein